ncbi:MAG: RraA family protein [Gemmatales bacterium]|nr:RraA family protein [Gemmatales bacterium]MDW7993652.1 RraA family protein [Gemmatales bacterium]
MSREVLAEYQKHMSLLYSAVLADALDHLGHRTSTLPHYIRPLAPHWRIVGRAVTLAMGPALQMPETPYALEMECVDQLQPGDVLVASTRNDTSCALWGELLSTACRARGAAGVVTDGLTRDVEKILRLDFPVFAAGCTPLDSKGRLEGLFINGPILIGDCMIDPGDIVFGDFDGVVVIPAELAAPALQWALAKVAGENQVRDELAAGKSVRQTFARYGIL